MKPVFLALAAVVAMFFSSPSARADGDGIILAVNQIPDVCYSMVAALRMSPEYLTYNPRTDTSAMANDGAYGGTWDKLYLANVNRTIFLPVWDNRPYSWKRFQREDPEMYDQLMQQGEEYASSYGVYRFAMQIYNEYDDPRYIYKLVAKSRMSEHRWPLLFLSEKDGLAQVFNQLKAADVIGWGPRAYPIVRHPGHILMYQIDADRIDVPVNQRQFRSSVACEIWKDTALARHNARLQGAQPQQPVASDDDDMNSDDVPNLPDTYPVCSPYAADVPRYNACNDSQKKIARMRYLSEHRQ